MTSFALSRTRVKRQKMKPPHWLWYLAVIQTFLVVWMLSDCLGDTSPRNVIQFVGAILLWMPYIPQLKSPYEPVMLNLRLWAIGLTTLFVSLAFPA
jgi:hypothetical protein